MRSISIRVALIGLVAIAIYSGHGLAIISGDPGHYYQYRHASVLPAYPTTAVLESLGLMAAEVVAAFLLVLLARRTKPAVRLLAVGVCAGAMLAAGLPLAMHAPPYYGGHLVWLFYAAGWMLPMAAIAAIESAVRARHPAPTVPAAIAKQK